MLEILNSNLVLWIFISLLGFAILQWIIIIFYTYNNSKEILFKLKALQKSSTGFTIIPHDLRKSSTGFTIIPYENDNFFKIWNLLPLILNSIIFFIIYKFRLEWNEDISVLVSDSGNITSFVAYKVIVGVLVCLFILVSIYSYHFQLKKQKNIECGKYKEIYWWDKRINDKIFFVRRFFLVPNMLNIFLSLLFATAVLVEIIYMIDSGSFKYIPFHGDHNGGFNALETLVLSSLLIALLWVSNSIFALVDHSKQGAEHMSSNITGIITGLAIVIITALTINTTLKFDVCSSSKKFINLEKIILAELNKINWSDHRSIYTSFGKAKEGQEYLNEIRKVKRFNLFSNSVIFVFLSAFWPIALSLYQKIRKRKKSFEED